MSLEEFVQKEEKRMEEDRARAIKAKGGLPYLPKFPEGESRVKLLREIPVDDEDDNGVMRGQFRANQWIEKDGRFSIETFAWSVNKRSPLYRDLVKLLLKAPIELKVIRTGDDKKTTRYTVKPLTA